MTVTAGASLDSAVAGINRSLDNARKVAVELNKQAGSAVPKPSASASSIPAASDSTLGSKLDVTA